MKNTVFGRPGGMRIADLSILDLLMFLTKEEVQLRLQEYTLIQE